MPCKNKALKTYYLYILYIFKYHSRRRQYDEATVTRPVKEKDLQEVHREIHSHLLLSPFKIIQPKFSMLNNAT